MFPFPLADLVSIPALASCLPEENQTAVAEATARQNQLTKPPGALGRLEDIALFMAGWQGQAKPTINQAQALVFAGNHGICAQGVNVFPQDVTVQMVANFENGGAAINQLARHAGADLNVIALDLDQPTKDFTKAQALSEADCLSAINRGAAAVDKEADIIILGEMGIGNSTVSAALAAAVFGGDPGIWVGAGTGSDAAGMVHKTNIVMAGLDHHTSRQPMDILCAFGGREQAAMIGATLAARFHRIPVLLDGYICCAALSVLFACDPAFLSHCLIGHQSVEPGHRQLVEKFGKPPLLDLSMRLGEGTGAALALSIVKAALACHNGMATFAEASVSDQQ